MYIHEIANVLHKHNGCIRRKSWPENRYLTQIYDTRLDCILLTEEDASTFRPYQFKVSDLLADDWEEY